MQWFNPPAPWTGKKIIIAIILVQLVALPILLIAVKQRQETRGRAATDETTQTQTNVEDQAFSESGNEALSPDLSSSFEEASEETALSQAPSGETNSQTNPQNSALKKLIFTYLPYWEVDEDADTYLQYKYMTHLIYHGISLRKNGVINRNNGNWNVWAGSRMEKIVRNARANGAKVLPNIVLFNGANSSGLSDFLGSQNAQERAVTQIMNFLKTSPQPVDGAAIDFEFPNSSQREELVSFIKDLRREMKAYNPNWDLVIAVPSYSYAGGGFDLQKLAPHVDGFFVMSYHLKNPGQAEKAGSTNPIGSLKSLADNYLEKVPGNKIVLGFPLYLAEWKTQDDSLRATKKPGTGGGKTVSQNECGLSGTTCTRLAQRYMKTYGRKYDDKDKAAYYSFYVCTGSNKNKGWHQVYFDDEQAFSDKFALVNNKNLGGVGFWAQNYDKGYLDTWKAIYGEFADKSLLPAPTKKPGFDVPSPIQHNGCTPPRTSETPTPSPMPSNASLSLDIRLIGIGPAGNRNPRKTSAKFNVDVFAPDAVKVGSFSKNLSYNQTLGTYKGRVQINIPKADIYNLYISSPSYLAIRMDRQLQLNITNELAAATLSPGDINQDASRNILDWNLVNACSIYNRIRNKALCPENSIYMTNADLDSNGKVDLDDLTLWLHEFRKPQLGN